MVFPSRKMRNKDASIAHGFSEGDMVEVCEGELFSLKGKIVSVDGSIVSVMPFHSDIKVSTIIFKIR